MAGEATIVVVGNATADAEVRYTRTGTAVANWTLACTPRVKDGDGWTDGEAAFYRCAAWDRLGESVADTVRKGMRLVVTGRLRPRSFTDRNGAERLSLDVEVDHVGPELRFATATVEKVARGGGQGGRDRDDRPARGGNPGRSGGDDYGDAWGSAPPAGRNDDEPPPF